MNLISRIKRKVKEKVKSIVPSNQVESINLDGGGERIDLTYTSEIDYENLDIYQKSHYRRYEYVVNSIPKIGSCGDFACGTGYGSVMLSAKANKVIGVDINSEVIHEVKKRYRRKRNIQFIASNLLDLDYKQQFDAIVSFETIEHLDEKDIPKLFSIFHGALKRDGKIFFSTPFMQEDCEAARKMGFHLTFYIDEAKVESWLDACGFQLNYYKYQNYQTHTIEDHLDDKDFIICCATKL